MFQDITDLVGRRIAIFGLSGNPPTGNSGHRGIVSFLVQTGHFDEVWILPVYQHMYSAKRSMVSYEDRVTMCKISMEDVSQPTCRVRVVMVEKYAADFYEQRKGREYRVGTIDIIDFINQHCPGLELSLVLGTDTYNDLIGYKWKDSERILSSVTLHVVARLGVDTLEDSAPPSANTESDKATTHSTSEARVVHHRVSWLTEVSSSLVRAISTASGVDLSGLADHAAAPGEDSAPQSAPALKDLLDTRVLDYIFEHKLYVPAAEHADPVLPAPPRAVCKRPITRPVP